MAIIIVFEVCLIMANTKIISFIMTNLLTKILRSLSEKIKLQSDLFKIKKKLKNCLFG